MDCNSSVGIDLHVHSTASDGTLTPLELVALAKRLNLGALAITDHDAIDGARQVLKAELPQGVAVISGVEISAAPPEGVSLRGSIHVLGYGFDLDHPELISNLQKAQDARRDRNPRILNRLARLGCPLTESEVQAKASDGGPVGRPHIAQALIARGYARDIHDAFDRFLGTGKPAYIDKYRMPFDRAIAIIHDAGGVAVLAHPGLLPIDNGYLSKNHLDHMTALGLDGIEVYYPEHTPAQIDHYQSLADQAGILATGGTDFHGQLKPDTQLGVADGQFHVPMTIYHQLMARIDQMSDR